MVTSEDRDLRSGELPEEARVLADTVVRLRAELDAERDAHRAQRIVDQASGALAARLGCSPARADTQLRRLAESSGKSLIDVSASLLGLPSPDGVAGQLAAELDRDLASVPQSVFEAARYVNRTATAGAPAAAAPVASDPAAAVDGASTADEIAELFLAATAELGGSAVMLMVVEPDGALRLVGSATVPTELVVEWQRVPAESNTAARAAARSGEAVWLPDLAAARKRYLLVGDPLGGWSSRVWLPVKDGQRVHAVIGVFWTRQQDFTDDVRRRVTALVPVYGRRLLTLLAARSPRRLSENWPIWVQSVLDTMRGSIAVLSPIRDDTGTVADFQIEAAGPDAVDIADRRGRQLVGLRILECYPTIAFGELWPAYLEVLDTGVAREVGPFEYTEVVEGRPRISHYSVRVNRFGEGLIVAWVRHDDDDRHAARLDQVQRLGNLGWFEWDLVTNDIGWSDQLYAVFGRDPSDGPVSLEAAPRIVLPDDLPRFGAAVTALLQDGESIDIQCRVQVGKEIRHLRITAEPTLDAADRTIEVHGVIQDITARERAREELAAIQRELEAQRRSIVEGNRLAIKLQEVILPPIEDTAELPGIEVAVRYEPAGEVDRVGGDWFHVKPLAGGKVLLAIGDVAGHGLPAAATMAKLRHALTGLAVTSSDPAQLLGWLNTVLIERRPPAIATAAVGCYDPADRTLTWAQAGHPAPLLARAGGVRRLPRPRGLLLGALADAAYATATVTLEPGDVLLLYTDGLVERPGADLDEGTEAVARALHGALNTTRRYPLREVLASLQIANPGDDACVLAVHVAVP